MDKQIDICSTCVFGVKNYTSIIGNIPWCCEKHWHCKPGTLKSDYVPKKNKEEVKKGLKVYAVRDIAGYKKGDEVQVFHAKEIDGETWFMIWSKNLKKWGFYKPENFAPYPFWMENDNGK